MQLTILDWLIMVGYLLIVIGIGFLGARKIHGTRDYFLGGQRFSIGTMIGQSFSVGTHPEMIVSLAGAVQTTGLSAIWFQWKNLFVTPFYWIMTPIFRRIRRTTTAEMMEDRYGPWMAVLYTVFALIFFAINMANLLKGAGKVIQQVIGATWTVNQIVVGIAIIFMFYSFLGGLVASVWNNFLQGLLIITLSFMLIPLAWPLVGGLTGVRALLPPTHLSLVTPAGIGVWAIFMLTLNGFVGIMAQPHILATSSTGKDEQTCRIGVFYGNYVKRFCTVGWTMVGLLVSALLAKNVFGAGGLHEPEEAFGYACRHLLFPGLAGLLLACILAAGMAACSAFMVDSGALLTQSLYRRHMRPAGTDLHYLLVGRLSGFLVALFAVFYAVFLIQRVLYSFLLTETMATYMGISLLGGIIWRRANRWGALASIIAAFFTNFYLYYLRDQRLDHWDANVFFLSLLSGCLALIVVSLLTKDEPKEKMSSFFGRLETPSEIPWSESLAVDEKRRARIRKQASEEGKQLILIGLSCRRSGAESYPFFHAFREDLLGLAKCFGWVLLLVFATWFLLG